MNASLGSNDSNTTVESHAILYQDFLDLWPSCACAVVFFLLLLWDVCKAFKRRAHWIPNRALVLSALTIQMLNLISYSDISYTDNHEEINEEAAELLTRHQPLFDCARLTMCVFTGYLVPGMVRSNWISLWSDIGGLILTVVLHMAFEVYSVWKYYRKYSSWFIVSTLTLFTASVLLLLILSCAALAGKSIHNILSLNIPLALSSCSNSSETEQRGDCNSIEDHVLKCWIVVRASQPDYVMARSVLISFTGLVVTISVLIVAIKWSRIKFPSNYDIAHKSTFFIQFAFILLGWSVVAFRWLTAVIYFPYNLKFLLHFEDFWTRTIVEVTDDLFGYSTGRRYREKIIGQEKLGPSYMVTLITAFRLHHILMPMRFWLQLLMVSLGKVCSCISEIVFGIMIRDFIQGPQGTAEFAKYQKALEIIRMPNEDASSLWIANKWGFQKTENHMNQGIKEGQSRTAELIKLIEALQVPSIVERGTAEAAPSIVVEKETAEAAPSIVVERETAEAASSIVVEEEEKYYKFHGKKSWKMEAVSLIYCMIYFYECNTKSDGIINDAIKASSQAWDFLDCVDSSDPEADIVSLAADKEFDTLEKVWRKRSNKLLVEQKIKKPLEEAIKKFSDPENRARTLENPNDSRDRMKLAVHINIYKTYKTVEPTVVNSVHRMEHLRCLLANVIVDCMDKELDKAVIENCSKWANCGMEPEIYHAAFIAGKAKGLRGKIKGNNENQVPSDQNL